MNPTAQDRCFPCPCCGYLTIGEEPPGTFEICPVCFWEDDNVQFGDPDFRGGANHVTLNEARKHFKDFGASERQFVEKVRPPREDEIKPCE
jgi:Cysteine-rich CPCC